MAKYIITHIYRTDKDGNEIKIEVKPARMRINLIDNAKGGYGNPVKFKKYHRPLEDTLNKILFRGEI